MAALVQLCIRSAIWLQVALRLEPILRASLVHSWSVLILTTDRYLVYSRTLLMVNIQVE